VNFPSQGTFVIQVVTFVLTVTGAVSVVGVFMGAHFCAAHAHPSIQCLYSASTVWLAAPAAQFAAFHQAQAYGMMRVVSGAALDVLAATGVLSGAEAIAHAPSARSFASRRSIYSAT
jgi:hypothetical protein